MRRPLEVQSLLIFLLGNNTPPFLNSVSLYLQDPVSFRGRVEMEERRQAASSLLSPALREYHAAFFPNSGVPPSTIPFVTYYEISEETKALEARTLTRAAFWEAAMRAASAIRDAGLTTKGDCAVHFFSDNRLEDLVLRLASVMCGTVPVTVNWQADTLERVAYKIRATAAKVVFHDKGVPEEQVRSLRQEFPYLKILSTESMLSCYDPLPESDFCRTVDAQDTRIIIFSSFIVIKRIVVARVI